ncbi:MAG: acyl-CoA dehydrogenase protein [Frankiales bacterium]|jgi:alkylation response protein AidB-like acyl-CoA dehydrogenase|nr:acyl-CoA dehydrogenase protein [Frankiales bacterium]
MHFQLTDEQRALREAVRSYLRGRFGPQQVRELYEAPESDGVPAALWQALGEQGWLAVLVPEEHDGIGLGLLDAAVLAREFGAGTVPGPWLGTVLAGEALRLAGSAEQQAEHLPRIAAGEVKGAVALLKAGYSPIPQAAPFQSSGGALTGRMDLVEYPSVADLLVVAASDGLYLVDPAASGVTITPQPSLDRTTRVGTVELAGVTGEKLPGSTPDVVQDLLDRAAVLVANDLVGISRKALTDTVEYDKTRVQFNRPVGSFQAIKHHLADLHIAVTFAEHAATYAAHAADVGADDRAVAASIAKSKAAVVANEMTGAMIQYHGGIGYTWEHDTHFYFKRSKRLEGAYGDAAQHRERIAKLVIDTARPVQGDTAEVVGSELSVAASA